MHSEYVLVEVLESLIVNGVHLYEMWNSAQETMTLTENEHNKVTKTVHSLQDPYSMVLTLISLVFFLFSSARTTLNLTQIWVKFQSPHSTGSFENYILYVLFCPAHLFWHDCKEEIVFISIYNCEFSLLAYPHLCLHLRNAGKN